MLSPNKKARIKARDNNRCVICNSREQLTIDHIVPLDLGGTNEDKNLRTLCQPCNVRKANKPPKHKAWFNFLFSRKTIYEFKNEIKAEMASRDGLVLIEAKKLIEDQATQIKKLIQAISDQQVTYSKRFNNLAERVKGLQDFHKLEWREEKIDADWLEEQIIFKGYKKKSANRKLPQPPS